MTPDKIVVTILGIALIGFIYSFFFGKSEEEGDGQNMEIIVDGGYKPSVIKLNKGMTSKITFLRKDANSCLEEVVIPDFKIKQYLPLNQKVTVEITPDKTGTFPFHCGMSMYFGKIKVV